MSVSFKKPILHRSSRFEAILDFEANLFDDKLKGKLELPDIPLPGKWSVNVESVEGGAKIRIKHSGVSVSAFGRYVTTDTYLYWTGPAPAVLLNSSKWHNHESAPRKNPTTGNAYGSVAITFTKKRLDAFAEDSAQSFDKTRDQPFRLVLCCQQASPLLDAKATGGERVASRLSNLNLDLLPHNVRLFFPSENHDGFELWTTSALLSETSDYFDDLLASGFSEAVPRRSKRMRKSEPDEVLADSSTSKDFDDSDEEADEVVSTEPQTHSELSDIDFSFRQITISQAAFSTYRAFLAFQQSGFVDFAPLRSAFGAQSTSSSTTRRSLLRDSLENKPSLPLPVSPKSLYRLAHYLRLANDDPLLSVCLEAFSAALTLDGAAHELFSDAAMCYDEVRKVAIDYVVKHWEGVTAKSSWQELAEKVKRDEVPGAAGVMFELLVAKDEAAKKAQA
ncbi:hypothetical protein JCM8097_006909 [Rhodosporidiobolus ruineniae]